MSSNPEPTRAQGLDSQPPEPSGERVRPWEPSVAELRALDDDWRAAEDQIKLSEQESRNAPIPPINELRYAGRHLLDALTLTDDAARKSEFEKAKRHVLRAKYDAAEVRILVLLDSVKRFSADYATIEIFPTLPEWHDILKLAREIQNRISHNRGDQTRNERRYDHHLAFVEYAEKLADRVALLDVAREELNKKLNQAREAAEQRRAEEASRLAEAERRLAEAERIRLKEKTDSRRWAIGIAVTSAGVGAAIARAYLSYRGQ